MVAPVVAALIPGILDLGGKLIERIFPDPEEAAKAKIELLKLQQEGALAQMAQDTQLALGQIEINKIEAASEDKFKSRWRPAIGWVCVAGVAYNVVLQPLLAWLSLGSDIPVPPIANGELLMFLLGTVLGVAVPRTVEKIRGTA